MNWNQRRHTSFNLPLDNEEGHGHTHQLRLSRETLVVASSSGIVYKTFWTEFQLNLITRTSVTRHLQKQSHNRPERVCTRSLLTSSFIILILAIKHFWNGWTMNMKRKKNVSFAKPEGAKFVLYLPRLALTKLNDSSPVITPSRHSFLGLKRILRLYDHYYDLLL